MKAVSECYPCLCRLVYQAAGLATEDEEVKAEAIREGLRVVDENHNDCRNIALGYLVAVWIRLRRTARTNSYAYTDTYSHAHADTNSDADTNASS